MVFDDIMDFDEPKLQRRKRRNKVLRIEEERSTIPIEDATYVPTPHEVIQQMDLESLQKSAEQQRNEVGVMEYAKEMIAGSCDDEKGKTLTKKL